MSTKGSTRAKRINEDFKKRQKSVSENDDYTVASENLTVDDKLKLLDEMGRPELVDLFKDWKPRASKRRQRGAPLDQRVAITVTDAERYSLNKEIEDLKNRGEKISISQFIRNRTISTIDINGWRDIAAKALAEIEQTVENEKALIEERSGYELQMDEEDDTDLIAVYAMKANEITQRLSKITAQNEKRSNRLTGRMSMPESEKVKWRAQRLCISSSDYLRMMIFGMEPDSIADSHMSLDAKRRFYISIIEVAENGWGTPPNIYECSQCANYMDELSKAQAEVKQLRNFG